MRGARVSEGAVVGEECLVEEEAILAAGVKVYPAKTIEAGAMVNQSVIWESRDSGRCSGARRLGDRQCRDHAGTRRPPRQRLRHDPDRRATPC